MTIAGSLNALEASGLIRLAQIQPELQYEFGHTLIQEAAYASLLKQERKRLHKVVGDTLEQLYASRLDELAGMLAHHFALAGEHEKGVAYSRRAARRAVATYAYDEAVQQLRMALDLLAVAGPRETQVEVLEELADVYRLLGEGRRAIHTYQQALAEWAQLEAADKLIAVRLHRKTIQTLTEIKWRLVRDEFEEASRSIFASGASLEAGLRLMEGEQPHSETVQLLIALSIAAWRLQAPADWTVARRYAQAAVDMAQQLGSPVDLSAALDVLGTVHFAQGRLREHLQVALQRLEITRGPRFNDPSAASSGPGQALREKLDSLRGVGSALMYTGEYAEAIPHLEEAERMAARMQAIDQQCNAVALQVQCWFRLDRWDDALHAEERVRDLGRKYAMERTGPMCFPIGLSATIHALRGDQESARADQTEAYDIMVAMTGLLPEDWPLRNQHY